MNVTVRPLPLRSVRPLAIALSVAAFTASPSAARTPAFPAALAPADSTVARWPQRATDPVRVWIQPASTVSHWSPTYVDEVQGAFAAWEPLHLGVPFRFVTDSADAEVRIRWVDRFNEPISGRTVCMRDDADWIIDASIELAVHHRDGAVLDDDAMHAMALHEIGHALGLNHVRDSASVMSPRVRVRVLSSADRVAARALYSRPTGTFVAGRP